MHKPSCPGSPPSVLLCHTQGRPAACPSLVALLCSVPPKADADSKEGSNSKADDEEKPKPPKERLQEAVRDSKVSCLKLTT